MLTKKEVKDTSKSPKKSCFIGSPQKNEENMQPLLAKEKISLKVIKDIDNTEKQIKRSEKLNKSEKIDNLNKIDELLKKDNTEDILTCTSPQTNTDKYIFRPNQDSNIIESEQEPIDPNLQTEAPDGDNPDLILNTESINETIIEYLDTEEELKKSVFFEGEVYQLKRKYINNLQGIELIKSYLNE